jgi:CPA1 family monovalent cation:H+ antiporter
MHDLAALAPLWLLVALLAASVAVAILTRRWSLPTSVVLVVVGLVIALALPTLHVSSADLVRPELLLAIVLPGLVFEAAFRTDLATIRPAAPAILMLGIPGVVVVAGIVAILLSATTGISPGEAFLVGSMVAATDPAAVLATFRHLPVPARLGTLVEMESLVNDGTGIVLFALALDLLAGQASLGGALVSFVVVVVGSTLLGAALGWAAVRLVGRVDEHVVELTITIVLAYGTYLLAETLGGSGVIATLVAAGAFGAGARGALTDRSLAAIDDVWELVAFLLTASVFLLVGVSIVPGTLVHAVGPIVWGVVATLVARAVVVYGLVGGGSRLFDRARRGGSTIDDRSAADDTPGPGLGPIPMAWLHVLFWAGLRGAVSVALALSLPPDLPNRGLLQGITFGIVLFTLLVQGTTVNAVVRRSGALSTDPRPGAPATTPDRP